MWKFRPTESLEIQRQDFHFPTRTTNLFMPARQAVSQYRTCAIECLNLAFLIDAQRQSAFRRIQIQPHDAADFLDEERIGRQLEGLDAVRLQRERPPDAGNGGLRHPSRLGHGPRRPVCAPRRRGFQGARDQRFHLRIPNLARSTGPGFIGQPLQAIGAKPLPPLAHRLIGDAQFTCNLAVLPPLGTTQHNTRPHRQPLRGFRPPRPFLELRPFLFTHHDGLVGRPMLVGSRLLLLCGLLTQYVRWPLEMTATLWPVPSRAAAWPRSRGRFARSILP